MTNIPTPNAYDGPISQGHDPLNISRLFPEIKSIEYEEAETVGSQFYTKSTEDNRGEYFHKAFRTGLIGNLARAAAAGTDLDDTPPYLDYAQTPAVFHGYEKWFGAYGFNLEVVEYDELHNSTRGAMQDLSKVAAFTEELIRHKMLVNGESYVSGWDKRADGTGIPLYATDHPIISDRTLLTSNILDTVSGANYATIRAIEEYGFNFRNQEGRPAHVRPDLIITGPSQAREFRMLYNTGTNVNQSNPNVPSPVADATVPTIIGSIHLDNPNDIHVRYTGWRENFFELDKYRSKTKTWMDTNPEYEFMSIATRTLYYYIDPRLAVYIPGVGA